MKLPRHAMQSVRLRLTLWNVGVLALVLLMLGASSHFFLQRTLLRALDDEMLSRAEWLVRDLERLPAVESERPVQWERGRLGGPPRPPPPPGAPPPGRGRANGPMARFFPPRALTLAGWDYARLTPETPWDEAGIAAARRGETVRSSVVLESLPARVLSLPLRHGGRVDGVLQVARPVTDVEDAVRASSRTLLMLAPLALLISGVVGAFLTSRALLPVRTLREAADRIQAEDLSHRLPVPGRDEFSELAQTFNEMLGRLERAFQQQARFTADASHELRTPLTVLRGNVSLALTRPRSPEEYRETLQRVQAGAERMSRLVEDLLLLARADAGQLLPDAEPVSLPEVLAAAAAALPARPISLDVDDGAGLTIRGSHSLLVTLFTNLLSNAARHTPPGGAITLRAAKDGSSAVVVVEDTGEGISPEHLPYLRERFYRVDDARSSEAGGTGLGLAICQSIAAAHGGALGIESRVGQGTTITVTLLLA
ncbi:MAG: HAMP domain-containing protein [Armatimonadetes bacterium]|nr:HAMP domain-containing protein [Armatimonadota bacterium]